MHSTADFLEKGEEKEKKRKKLGIIAPVATRTIHVRLITLRVQSVYTQM